SGLPVTVHFGSEVTTTVPSWVISPAIAISPGFGAVVTSSDCLPPTELLEKTRVSFFRWWNLSFWLPLPVWSAQPVGLFIVQVVDWVALSVALNRSRWTRAAEAVVGASMVPARRTTGTSIETRHTGIGRIRSSFGGSALSIAGIRTRR